MSSPPTIDDYRFGRIEIDHRPYTQDVIILPSGVLPHWWRQEGHVLHAADLEAILEAPTKPRTLIVGLGAYSRMRVATDARRALEEAGIELIALSTERAVEKYNALRQRGDVAAALHLTC